MGQRQKLLLPADVEPSKLRALLDEHSAVAVTNATGTITFVNDRFCAISKYSEKDILGQDHRILNSGHHPKAFFRYLWNTINLGRAWSGEFRNRAKDGSLYWVATTITPIVGQNRQLRQFVSISTDLTEQKNIRAELAEKLRLQRLLVELSSKFAGLSSVEVDGAIEETLCLIAETLDIDRSGLWQVAAGQEGMTLTHGWQRPDWPQIPLRFETRGNLPWAHATISEGRPFSFSSIAELPPEAARDAEVFKIHGIKSCCTIPLVANGKVFGAIGFSSFSGERQWTEDEISDLKLIAQIIANVVSRQRAEMNEEQLRSELAHASRVATLGEIAAALAHELNQPLAAILSNAQAARRFLADGAIDPIELKGILDDIVRDDKRAGGVINNLRSMVSRQPLPRESCCLIELTNEVLELLKAETLYQSASVHTSFDFDVPRLSITRVELQQVLVNLVLNALQAMSHTPKDQRSITITIVAGENEVRFEIRDQGTGIAPELLPNIFASFISTKESGLGIGLSICRRIIQSHEGDIQARNHEAGGACFTFTLPVHGRHK